MPNCPSSGVQNFKTWFETHVSLDGHPYTLDFDQARAVLDDHKNTLVTARAGSGKTRVIVAKVAYLVAQDLAKLDQIAAFMFNRTAAAEVNERIGKVAIDGVSLYELNHHQDIKVASTFHKFALDFVKLAGEQPQLISESERDQIIIKAVRDILAKQKRHISPSEYTETLRLVSSFISRAGQKYLGSAGLEQLRQDIEQYITKHRDDSAYTSKIQLHRTALAAYETYLAELTFPKIDFNILMARAAELLRFTSLQHSANKRRPTRQPHSIDELSSTRPPHSTGERSFAQLPSFIAKTTQPHLTAPQQKVRSLKYLLVDEYQDFSFLFFNLIQSVRHNCPQAHLFSVGDDWQAINRFAGSDVNYFINFSEYFPEDVTNIPLMTNYRSDKRIVENANQYMLKNYNPDATKAIPFSKKNGKIYRLNPAKTKFDASDLQEDALGDAKFMQTLAKNCGGTASDYAEAAQYLKTVFKIIKKHHKSQILLLHRHNFTSFSNVTLENFLAALRSLLVEQNIMTREAADAQIRGMTMHKSKGLESEIVILLELNRDQVLSTHPHATTFEIFGDTLAAEKSDQHRLLYVALTRAKRRLYIISSDQKSPA